MNQLAMDTLSLSPTHVDLWLAYCRTPDDELLARYRQLLSPEERKREARFHFARDRRRYLVSRALLRSVLSRYAPTAPADWQFATNDHGRPHIVDSGERQQVICFNLSHTSEVVLLGVSGVTALGVDVEAIRSEPLDGIAERFFAATEAASLRALPPKAQATRFFEYWTLKESYIKARGLGLSIPLDAFAFDLRRPAQISFSIAESLGDDAADWRFWQIQPAPGHFGAVCAARYDAAPTLSLRVVVPLVAEETLDCPVVRQSAPVN